MFPWPAASCLARCARSPPVSRYAARCGGLLVSRAPLSCAPVLRTARRVVLLVSRLGSLLGALAAARPGPCLSRSPGSSSSLRSACVPVSLRRPGSLRHLLLFPLRVMFFCRAPPWAGWALLVFVGSPLVSPAAGGLVPGVFLVLVHGSLFVVRGCAPSPAPAAQMLRRRPFLRLVVVMFLRGAAPLDVRLVVRCVPRCVSRGAPPRAAWSLLVFLFRRCLRLRRAVTGAASSAGHIELLWGCAPVTLSARWRCDERDGHHALRAGGGHGEEQDRRHKPSTSSPHCEAIRLAHCCTMKNNFTNRLTAAGRHPPTATNNVNQPPTPPGRSPHQRQTSTHPLCVPDTHPPAAGQTPPHTSGAQQTTPKWHPLPAAGATRGEKIPAREAPKVFGGKVQKGRHF